MHYRRVIPRDLFNEANLLKCLGHLWLKLEGRRTDAAFDDDEAAAVGFRVEQDSDDGSISVDSIAFLIKSVPHRLFRPLNSREPWPLWCGPVSMMAPFFEDVAVFTEEGGLTEAFLRLIGDKA